MIVSVAKGSRDYYTIVRDGNGDVFATGCGRYADIKEAEQEARLLAKCPAINLDPEIVKFPKPERKRVG